MPQLLEVIGPKSGTAPLRYTVTEQGTVDLMSIFAHFEGAGASGSFRPTVTVRAQNGTILARIPTDETLAAGDTADVTFAPFLRGAASSGGGSGIQFDVTPQTGGFLDVETTGVNGSFGIRMIADLGTFGINAVAEDVEIIAGRHVELTAGQDIIEDAGRDQSVTPTRDYSLITGTGEIFLRAKTDTTVRADGTVKVRGAVNVTIDATTGNVFMGSLPILDPGVPGALWNSGGFLAISP